MPQPDRYNYHTTKLQEEKEDQAPMGKELPDAISVGLENGS